MPSGLAHVAVLGVELVDGVLAGLDVEVAVGHLDGERFFSATYDAREVVGDRADHRPDRVVAVVRRGLGRQPVEQRRVDGQREPALDLGVGERVAHPLGEGRLPFARSTPIRAWAWQMRAVAAPATWVGVGREPGADAASLVGGVDPDQDARDLEVVVQGSVTSSSPTSGRPRTRRTPRRTRPPCPRRGAS